MRDFPTRWLSDADARQLEWARMIADVLFLIFVAVVLLAATAEAQVIPSAANRYRADLIREAHVVLGIEAPISTLAAQIEQESGWKAGVTAWDNGRGLAQFMDPTAEWVSEKFEDLGPADPYNPKWAMRAMVRLDDYNVKHVQGNDLCQKWGAALKSYNAGLGYVKRAQSKSSNPGVWFGVTEHINAGQGRQNFEYSRQYPRWIMLKRQPRYANWGAGQCKGIQ